eukprot:CAMPEP_0196807292 /NCGR_PEP_ID=MMETSP1362-20130617/7252_1 /TAXON_ID=163516 /ORGANISM="Leptocylindrus danicus, Strain CCMP1856" /LENGTH=482 /DNA_ID=CAMNT_0042181139 /DNA_START=313 /DNA_END=1761 /DNA_ORIENTATION=+
MDEAYSICTSSNKENTASTTASDNNNNNNNHEGSDHMLDDPLVGSILSANCTGNVCDSNTLMQITMAATSQSRFLVEHAVDKSERRLLSPLKVDQVMTQLQELPLSLSNSNSAVTSSSCANGGVTHDAAAESSTHSIANSQSQTSGVAVMDRVQLQPSENGILGRYNKQNEDDTTVQMMRKNNAQGGNGQILVLRMRVNFADFYRSTYLDAFPRHIEKGSAQARTIDAAPEVAPAHSHDSLMQALSVDSEMEKDGSAPRNVRLALSQNKEMFLNLFLQGSLGLKDQDAALMGGTHQVSVISHVARTSNHNSKQLVLLDRRTRSPVAVCTLKSKYGPPVITIHSPNPNVFCQAPSPGIKFEGRALYPYAEFHVEGEWPLPVRYSISFAVGNNRYEDQPSYRASHIKVGSPDISVVGKTGSESVMTGCCLINLSKSSDRFTLSIAKGVDPAIFICLAAIVDEVLEHTMRRQFANHKRDEINVRK